MGGGERKRLLHPNTGLGIEDLTGILGFEFHISFKDPQMLGRTVSETTSTGF